ncbi:DNA-binding protein [Cupriavidus basilensis]
MKAKAELLVSIGLSPTVRNVRSALGDTGALDTIARHLRQFWAERNDDNGSPPVSMELLAAREPTNSGTAITAAVEIKTRLETAVGELEEMAERLAEAKTSLQTMERGLLDCQRQLHTAEALLSDSRHREVVLQSEVAKLQETIFERRLEIERLAPLGEHAAGLKVELRKERALRVRADALARELLTELRLPRATHKIRHKAKKRFSPG